MQIQPSSSDAVQQTILELARVLAGGLIGSVLTWLHQRGKLKPEITVIEATAAKTFAEARHLNGETLQDAYTRIEELFVIADQQRVQISRVQLAFDKSSRNEEFLEEELQWLNNVIKAAGVDLAKYGHMRKTIKPSPPQ